MAKNTICLWYDKDAEDAARFYAQTFPDSAVGAVTRAPGDFPDGKEGDVLVVEFTVAGVACIGLNGGPHFKFNEAVSFQVFCKDQQEIDYYWERLTAGGDPKAQQCGWLKDKFGLSWQIVPTALPRLLADPDREKSQRVMQAMLGMKKIDVAAIRAAADGAPVG